MTLLPLTPWEYAGCRMHVHPGGCHPVAGHTEHLRVQQFYAWGPTWMRVCGRCNPRNSVTWIVALSLLEWVCLSLHCSHDSYITVTDKSRYFSWNVPPGIVPSQYKLVCCRLLGSALTPVSILVCRSVMNSTFCVPALHVLQPLYEKLCPLAWTVSQRESTDCAATEWDCSSKHGLQIVLSNRDQEKSDQLLCCFCSGDLGSTPMWGFCWTIILALKQWF